MLPNSFPIFPTSWHQQSIPAQQAASRPILSRSLRPKSPPRSEMAPSVAFHEISFRSQTNEIETSAYQVPITKVRKPYLQSGGEHSLKQAGTARANIAASAEVPYGTSKGDWAEQHRDETVLQQHLAFFDRDSDGIIWPMDTYRGFHDLGFNFVLSFLALLIIHGAFSYVTLPPGHFLPDPAFRICVDQIGKAKHGSDSGTYDNEGRFVPQKFEDIFAKYAGTKGKDKDSITLMEVFDMLSGQRVIFDPFGWAGAIFEWIATYILLWPKDGRMKKDDIRRVYDGSIFYEIAAKRAKLASNSKQKK